jgi:hypothetical protein
VQYLRKLAGAYVKTKELAKELHQLGCGDLDVEGILRFELWDCIWSSAWFVTYGRVYL